MYAELQFVTSSSVVSIRPPATTRCRGLADSYLARSCRFWGRGSPLFRVYSLSPFPRPQLSLFSNAYKRARISGCGFYLEPAKILKTSDFKYLYLHTHTHSSSASRLFSTTSRKHTGGMGTLPLLKPKVLLYALPVRDVFSMRYERKEVEKPERRRRQNLRRLHSNRALVHAIQLCSASSRRATCCRSCRSSAKARSRLAMRQRISRTNLSML